MVFQSVHAGQFLKVNSGATGYEYCKIEGGKQTNWQWTNAQAVFLL